MNRFLLVCVVLFLAFTELTGKKKPGKWIKPPKKPPCRNQIESVCPDADLTCRTRTCINFYVNKMPLNKKCHFTQNCVAKQKTCKCDGYAYDARRSICVHSGYCTPYWWSPATKRAQSENADLILKTGGFGIIRYNDNNNYMVGRLDTGDGTAYPLWYDTNMEFEIKVTDPNNTRVEMLLALPGKAQWKIHHKEDLGKVPKDAVLAGKIYPQKKQYIGRNNQSGLKPGKVQTGILYIYNTASKSVEYYREYHVLCIHIPSGSSRSVAGTIAYFLSMNILYYLH